MDSSAVLEPATAFYRQQLDRDPEALDYLGRRGLHDPALIEELGIGYAPETTLRRYLTAQGYSFDLLRTLGLINAQGADALYQRVVFPLYQGRHIVNFYGRSVGAAFAHCFLPGSKGSLYGWEKVRHLSAVILVEGLFDYAILRQAGYSNVTCSLGTHLSADQFRQLCDRQGIVYLVFDTDPNQSGQQAAEQLAQRPIAQDIPLAAFSYPPGTIPTPSSSPVATATSSRLSWRRHRHEVPGHRQAEYSGSIQSDPRGRTMHRPRSRMGQPFPRSPIRPPCR